MAINSQKRRSDSKNNRIAEFYKLASMVMSKVGIIGFIVISIVTYIFFFVPQTLKNEITNTWLLFKCSECNNIYIILLVILGILVVIQNYFYRTAIKIKDGRISEITREKSALQEKLLNKKLNSTNEEK